jgi:small subunit ribosomal protein S8
MTDPIGDMLTRLRNAVLARHQQLRMPHSKIKESIAQILRHEGFIQDFKVEHEKVRTWLEIDLRYLQDEEPAFKGAKRISRPGLRVYSRAHEIPRVMGGIGVALISTSQGLMTGHDAYRRRVGGEVLAFVW